MKRIMLAVSLAILLLSSFSGAALAAPVTDPSVLRDLAAVRNATAKYHDVEVALAEGFVPVSACVGAPGVGAMGYHYLNPARAMDGTINLSEPEILLYIDSGQGLKLVGVEYFFPIGAPGGAIPPTPPPSPTLFGRTFGEPMLGHDPAMPPHYDLHVWVWHPNPAGMFAEMNSSLTCQ